MYKRIDLNNGARVILNRMPRMESVALGVWVAAGSRNEKAHLSGISHFLEHMVFKGTPTRSTRKIKEEIEGRGGSLNAFTSEEITCYIAKVNGSHLNIALNVISDMVLNALMREKDIELERTVIIEEIKMYKDLPNHHVHDILSEVMWPHHQLGKSVAGNIGSVSSITRKDLIDYKKANYIPENIVLVLCGNLDYDSVIRKVKQIYRVDTKIEPKSIIEFNKAQVKPQIRVLHKNTEQSRLCMGLHTFGRMHKDRYILGLLHIILGANMSSRLFENVREKRGLAYEIGTELKRYRDTGAFVVNAGIEHTKVKEAVALIIKEFRNIKKKLVSEKELKRAKEFFKVQLSLALEDTLDHMLWLGENMLSSGKLPNRNDVIKRVDSISSYDIKRVAKDIFSNKNINLALIGPMKDKDKKAIERELAL